MFTKAEVDKLTKMGINLDELAPNSNPENKLQYGGAIALKEGGGIHIKPSKKGTFTTAAKKHGKGVQEFASQVMAHKENYSPAMVKKANFAKNAAKWHHAEGGEVGMAKGGLLAMNYRKGGVTNNDPNIIFQKAGATVDTNQVNNVMQYALKMMDLNGIKYDSDKSKLMQNPKFKEIVDILNKTNAIQYVADGDYESANKQLKGKIKYQTPTEKDIVSDASFNNKDKKTPYLSEKGYKAINQFENTLGTYDANGNPIGMGKGDNYAQTADKKEIEMFIDNTIGKDTWDRLPENVKTQAYSFMFNNGVIKNSRDTDGNNSGNVYNYNVWKGLAQALNNATGGNDTGEERRNYTPQDAIDAIKREDLSNPDLYNNYVSVLGDQYNSIATNTDAFKVGAGLKYANTLKNRPKTLEKIMSSDVSQKSNKSNEDLKTSIKFTPGTTEGKGLLEGLNDNTIAEDKTEKPTINTEGPVRIGGGLLINSGANVNIGSEKVPSSEIPYNIRVEEARQRIADAVEKGYEPTAEDKAMFGMGDENEANVIGYDPVKDRAQQNLLAGVGLTDEERS